MHIGSSNYNIPYSSIMHGHYNSSPFEALLGLDNNPSDPFNNVIAGHNNNLLGSMGYSSILGMNPMLQQLQLLMQYVQMIMHQNERPSHPPRWIPTPPQKDQPSDFELRDKATTANNPHFIDKLTDIEATNGTIHGIDEVLLPFSISEEDNTIAGIVSNSGDGFDDNHDDFDILLKAIEAAGLSEALSDNTSYLTVFAPTDSAFIKLANTLDVPADNRPL